MSKKMLLGIAIVAVLLPTLAYSFMSATTPKREPVATVSVAGDCSSCPFCKPKAKPACCPSETAVAMAEKTTACPCGENCACCDACKNGGECKCTDCKCCESCPGKKPEVAAKKADGCPCGENCSCCDACKNGGKCNCTDCKCCEKCPKS